MANQTAERIWSNMISVSVSDHGYEWRDSPPFDAELRLWPRTQEVIETETGYTVRRRPPRDRQKTGATLGRQLVGSLRELADQLDRLYPTTDRETRNLENVKNGESRDEQARALIVAFANQYGTLTDQAATLPEWVDGVMAFRAIDRLCTAVKRERWAEIDARMVQQGREWWYQDTGLAVPVCRQGEYWDLIDGRRMEWWHVAGREAARGKLAFARIMNAQLHSAFGVRVSRTDPTKGTMLPETLLASAYFVLWRSVAGPDHDRYCEYCDERLPADTRADKRFCSDRCKQANHRRERRKRRATA